MTSPARRQMRKRTIRVAMVVGILLLLVFTFRGHAIRMFSYIQRPLVAAGTWITDKTEFLFANSQELQARVEELEQQRNALAVDYAELEQLRTENDQLRRQLSFLSRQTESSVSASIIVRSATNQSSTFVIDRGERDGIVVGSPVIVGEGYLVGKVTSVMPSSAVVTATTDSSMAIAATLLNEGRTMGIAQGSMGRLITLSYIPHEETINVNDLIVTSGLEDGIPSGLIIGIVNTVTSDSTLPFQEAVVEPLVDIREHHIVSVLIESL